MFYQCNFESRLVPFPSPFPLRYKAFFSNAVKSAAVKDSGTGVIQSSNGTVGLPLFISSLLRCPVPAINAPIFAESNAFGAVFSTACRQFCPFSLPQRFLSPSRTAPQTSATRPQYPAEHIHRITANLTCTNKIPSPFSALMSATCSCSCELETLLMSHFSCTCLTQLQPCAAA